MIMTIPAFQNQTRGTTTGYNRCQSHLIAAFHRRQIHRHTCTGNDNIHACPNGSLHIVLIMMGCDHHIDTQKTSAPADCSGFGCFLIYCFDVAGKGILPEIFFAISRMCRRNHTHAAFLHDSTGKISQRNTNSHTALNNRLFQIL